MGMENFNNKNEGFLVTEAIVWSKIREMDKDSKIISFNTKDNLSFVEDYITKGYIEFQENTENRAVYKIPDYVWINKSDIEGSFQVFEEKDGRVAIKNPLL